MELNVQLELKSRQQWEARERQQWGRHLCWVKSEWIQDWRSWVIKIHGYILDKRSWCLFSPRAWHEPKNNKWKMKNVQFKLFFSSHHQFVVNCFHDNLLWCVLWDIKSEFQNFIVSILLDQWRIDVGHIWWLCSCEIVVGWVCGGTARNLLKLKKWFFFRFRLKLILVMNDDKRKKFQLTCTWDY
jgi:hypothetical protein